MKRHEIVCHARRWLGTPYLHQASTCGAGADCLGFVRGVWRDVIGTEPELPPPYTPDWAERSGAETLLLAARRHLHEIAPAAMREGDVLLFRMAAHAPVKHCGVLVSKNTFLHAYWGQSVLETRLASWWRARLVAAFSFPGVED